MTATLGLLAGVAVNFYKFNSVCSLDGLDYSGIVLSGGRVFTSRRPKDSFAQTTGFTQFKFKLLAKA